MNLTPYREAILRACEQGLKSRNELFVACGEGIGQRRFNGLVQTLIGKGLIVAAAKVPNPNKGQGRGLSNTPFVNLYRVAPLP